MSHLRDPAQTTLGIKRRGGSQGLEIGKAWISTRPTRPRARRLACPIGLWGKWSAAFALDRGA